ncbi:MAG: RNA methyltransferase [Eubacteriales bacterium]|nr:RNA methyltransferase [Eubacteriales bacterium]
MATSLTNLEIHDMARTCMTFGIDLCYIVSPLARQREIAERLVHHWVDGYGATYNPARGEALRRVRISPDIDTVLKDFGSSRRPLIIGTSSRKREAKTMSSGDFHDLVTKGQQPALVLFGTGWGLAEEVVDLCDRMLEPISGAGDYNHLSLRVALGIILDRIFSERGGHHE